MARNWYHFPSLDGSTYEINNDLDFLEAVYLIVSVCSDIEEDFDEECFEFVYPISFILPDGKSNYRNDEDWDEIDLWYEENKDEGPWDEIDMQFGYEENKRLRIKEPEIV